MSGHVVESREDCPCCEGRRVRFQRKMGGVPVLECQACGLVFSGVLPNAKEVASIYERLYEEFGLFEQHRREVDRIRKTLERGRRVRIGWARKRFFNTRKPLAGSRLLDIGCGTGLFLTAAFQAGWRASGVEVSGEAAELGQRVHNLPIQVGCFEELEIRKSSFEAVTAWEVLEHILQPKEFLGKVLNALVPGGTFAGSVPNYARRRYRYGNDLGPLSMPPIHLNFWNPSSLQKTLIAAGFRDVEVSGKRISIDLLRPLRSTSWRKVVRFVKVAIGGDLVSSMFFVARRPS